MSCMLRLTLMFVILLIGSHRSTAFAQTQRIPALIADLIQYNAKDDVLIATGNVEIFSENRILRASKITYLNETGLVQADGPITISEPGEATLTADYAELDTDLRAGIIHGARLILAQNFQLAAADAQKLDDRFTVLRKTLASSCQVCVHNPTPLWLIRAERIVKDNETRLLHFEDARFELFGATIAYLPYFSIPDPSVDRATGFLQPEIKSTGTYGTGVKIPYFIVISDATDVTVAPFFTSTGTTVIDGEYRQRFKSGAINIEGALGVSEGTTASSKLRGYLFASGGFDLKNDYNLSFNLRRTSDKGFLREFGYSTTDRLTSTLGITRQRGNEYVSYGATAFQSLRDQENDDNIPNVFPAINFDRYWDNASRGERISVSGSAVGLIRQLGRDVLKADAKLQWERNFQLPIGLRANTLIGAHGQLYKVSDDPNFSSDISSRLVPTAAIELRWPLARASEESLQIIEPVAQLIYSDVYGEVTQIPNEDSASVEFDASNLFALNKFPGSDLHETGLRLNLGVNYTRIDSDGWEFGLTVGRVIRKSAINQFSTSTGLNNLKSNFVAAANLDLPPYLSLSNQTLFDDDFSFSRNDIQASFNWGRWALSSSYVFLLPDITAGAPSKRQEFSFNTSYRLSDNWAVDAAVRRNLVTGRYVSTDFGIQYGNECIRADFSVSRRFTNSNSVPPDTSYGLEISLAGLGGSGSPWPAHKCTGL